MRYRFMQFPEGKAKAVTFILPTDWHQWMPKAHHENPQCLSQIDGKPHVIGSGETLHI